MRGVRLVAGAWAVVLAASTPGAEQAAGGKLPPRFDAYLNGVVKPTAHERRRLLEGAPLIKLLDSDASKEMAVFGAIWINAPMRRYVEAVQDIERFESGKGFNVTKRISVPPTLENFAQMHLTAEDVSDLRTCRVGDCEVKLGERALEQFRTQINWSAPDARQAADALMRRLTFEYVVEYLNGGNERLAVYRDDAHPRRVADEFRGMVDTMPQLTPYMDEVRRFLLEYPAVTMPDTTGFLYWQETEFGLKPTIRVSHLAIREGVDDTVVASKMLYASHYFWTGLELRVLLRDPARGPGFWFITINRSRIDGLTGFMGMFVRWRVRSGVQEGALTVLEGAKRRVEQAR
jgi:hypothetical protein